MDIEDVILIGAAIFFGSILETIARMFAQHFLSPWWKEESMGSEDRKDTDKLASDAIHWLRELQDDFDEYKEETEARLVALEEEYEE